MTIQIPLSLEELKEKIDEAIKKRDGQISVFT